MDTNVLERYPKKIKHKEKKRRPGNMCREVLLYKTPNKTDTTGPLSKISLELLFKQAEARLVEAKIVTMEFSADTMISNIVMLYREDIVQRQGKQDMALASLIATLYKAGEMLHDYNSTFLSHIENLQGNLSKYQLKNRNIIEFLMGFILFTKRWRKNKLGLAQEWLDYSKSALKSVGSNAWLADLCYLLARWEHGLALCGDRKRYSDHLANEYRYCEHSRQHCLHYMKQSDDNISYKMIICAAKMIQLKLDLPAHHKRFPFKREFALQQLRYCTVTVQDLGDAHALQDQLRKEAKQCHVHQTEVHFYIHFGDIYLLIREMQLVALDDYFKSTDQTFSIPQAWERERWMEGNPDNMHSIHVKSKPESKDEQVTFIVHLAIQICDQLLGNKVYVDNKHYKDVIAWLEESIKPYLRDFYPQTFCRQSNRNSTGWMSYSSEEEPNRVVPVPRMILQPHDSIESKSSI